jgi:hypothetical protein
MQFRDTNALDTLNQVTNMMLQPCLGRFASIFFDDVQLFSPSHRAHLRHIRILLTTLRWYRFYLGKSKSKWFARSLLSLGALITDDGIAVDPLKWDTIANWPTPRNKKDVLRFQGMINWMRDHLKDLASVMAPLTALTGSREWQWGDLEEAAFAKVKSMVLALFKLIDWEKVQAGEHKLYMFTDASIAGSWCTHQLGSRPRVLHAVLFLFCQVQSCAGQLRHDESRAPRRRLSSQAVRASPRWLEVCHRFGPRASQDVLDDSANTHSLPHSDVQ